MLGLENWRTGLLVNPILEADLVVVTLDLFNFETLVPRVGHDLAIAFEVVFHVTLATDKAAHLLPRRQGVRLIVLRPVTFAPALDAGQMGQRVVASGQRFDAIEETGPSHTQLHRLRVVTVDAADRMADKLARFD